MGIPGCFPAKRDKSTAVATSDAAQVLRCHYRDDVFGLLRKEKERKEDCYKRPRSQRKTAGVQHLKLRRNLK
jgi:dipeptidase